MEKLLDRDKFLIKFFIFIVFLVVGLFFSLKGEASTEYTLIDNPNYEHYYTNGDHPNYNSYYEIYFTTTYPISAFDIYISTIGTANTFIISGWTGSCAVSTPAYNLTGSDVLLSCSGGILSASEHTLTFRPPSEDTLGVRYGGENQTENLGNTFYFQKGQSELYSITTEPYFRFLVRDVFPNITLDSPPAYSSQVINLEVPIDFYIQHLEGSCGTNGNNQVFIWNKPSSYLPNVGDFASQAISCSGGVWEYDLYPLVEGYNSLTAWSANILLTSSTPIYDFDYVDTTVYLNSVMSFASTTDSYVDYFPAFPCSIGLEDIFSLQEYNDFFVCSFNYLVNPVRLSLFNKIPFGYWKKIKTDYNNTPRSSDLILSIDFEEIGFSTYNIIDFTDLNDFETIIPEILSTAEKLLGWVLGLLTLVGLGYFLLKNI